MGQGIIKNLLRSNLTFRLMAIIFYLGLIAVGNLFGIYKAFQLKDTFALLISIMSFLVYIVPAYGLLLLRKWGRWMEIAVSSLVVVIFCPLLIITGSNVFISLFAMIIHGYIVLYLCSTECKQLFKLLT